MSTRRRGLLAVGWSPDAGLPAHRIEADGGPAWPIRFAAERCGGGVRENGTWGRSGHPGPISSAKRTDFGIQQTASVNTFLKGRVPAKTRPSSHHAGDVSLGFAIVVLPKYLGGRAATLGVIQIDMNRHSASYPAAAGSCPVRRRLTHQRGPHYLMIALHLQYRRSQFVNIYQH